MKKLALLFLLAGSITANAQYVPMGAGPYTQNFDGLTAGSSALPPGWFTYFSATNAALGNYYGMSKYVGHSNIDLDSLGCDSFVFAHGFFNYASAVVTNEGDLCAAQDAYTNRALGCRPSTSHDSGSFNFLMTSTAGMSNINISFRLQSLDTGTGKQLTWVAQYGLGTTPATWVNAASSTGYWTTGGHGVFFDTANTASFDAGMSNNYGPVWIRIVALAPAVGGGYVAVTAIDSFQLNWTGTATAGVKNVNAPTDMSLTVLGSATSDNINLGYTVSESGNYKLAIYDLTGRVLYNTDINANEGVIMQNYSVKGLNLPSGIYIAKMTNGVTSGVAKIVVE